MKNILWYKEPAKSWLEGLPIGNGRLAAMVWGDSKADQLSLNHEWLWRGVNRERDNECVAEHLEEIRELLRQKEFYKASTLTNTYLSGKGGYISTIKARVDPYQPAGDLYFQFSEPTEYIKRQLDISNGITSVERRVNNCKVISQFIANPEYNLIFGRWHCEENYFSGKLSFSRVIDPEAIESYEIKKDKIIFKCAFQGGIHYQVEVAIKTDGKLEHKDGIYIENATEVFVAINIATSVKGIEKELQLYPVPNVSWKELVEGNNRTFKELLGRLRLEIDVVEPDIPTNERLALLKEGQADPGLVLLHFNFGRYLLVASSISGELPANLQGKWNKDVEPAWDSDYHFDINLEMNYWMVEPSNIGECAEPLLKYIERFVPHAKKAAKDLYGCRGIYLPIQTDAWGRSTPESLGWAAWIGAAPWIAQHFWWHYTYSGDKEFLRTRAYPLFKEVVAFYEDYLVKDENGIYQIMPSQSPENRFEGTGEWPVSIGISTAMDIELAQDALRYAINSSEILGVDEEKREVWCELKDNLEPLKIGKNGNLLEWDCERVEVEPGHRHVSHLYGLFPSDLINPIDTPVEFQGAIEALRDRLEKGSGHTGWSRAWVACLVARIGEPEQFWEHLNALVRDFTTNSLLNLHPPTIFQIDGNLGAVGAVLEAIVQTWGGKTHLLRALPKVWETGSLYGVKIPGGHLLNLKWEKSELTSVEVILGYSKKVVLADLGDQFILPPEAKKVNNDVELSGELNQKIILFRNNNETSNLVNPLLPLDEFIPDVEARVFKGSDGQERLFLYGSHDEYHDGTWCSYQYRVYSAPLTDLGNWTDHGVSFASRKGEGYIWNGEDSDGIPWIDARLYAPDVLQIGDKYYLASCLSEEGGLGMSVSDTPEGPFSPATQIVYDTDGEPLGSIDPTLYTEDDKVYLIWGQRVSFGGEGLVGVELKKDEKGNYSIAKRSTKKYLFGDKENPDQGFGFYEGPSIRKIGEKYYILYPSDKGKGVHMMSYATADVPLGPYTFRGNILDNDGCDLESGNNHGCLCEVNGQWYIFYHRGFGNSNMRRKVCVEPITILPDGTIAQVEMTNHGFGGPISPYEKVEAAYATRVRLDGFKPGCYLVEYSKDLHPLIQITGGNCVEYKDVDFGVKTSTLQFTAHILQMAGGSIELVLDEPDSEPVGILTVAPSNSEEWITVTTFVKPITGVHKLYLRFKADHFDNICELADFWFDAK